MTQYGRHIPHSFMPRGKMTRQEAFNVVWRSFVIEKAPPSLDHESYCVYRGPNGEKCAVGLLIPDDLYRMEFEGKSLRSIVCLDSTLRKMFSGDTLQLLLDMQSAHDDNCDLMGGEFNSAMKRDLMEIWDYFGLEIPEEEEVTQ